MLMFLTFDNVDVWDRSFAVEDSFYCSSSHIAGIAIYQMEQSLLLLIKLVP